jgi:hypothetical protein
VNNVFLACFYLTGANIVTYWIFGLPGDYVTVIDRSIVQVAAVLYFYLFFSETRKDVDER